MNAVRDRTGKRAADAESADGREPAAMRAALDADDAIADATSSDDVDEIKPAPDLIEQIYDSAGVPVFLADGAVFIGGTVWDVRASAKAGVRCVALMSGGVPRGDLEEAGAFAVRKDPSDLLRRLDSSALAPAYPPAPGLGDTASGK